MSPLSKDEAHSL